ncbi:MAG TPA: Fic family protein [Microthrixaceae bacterium]|jgi:Fic family protein|nr:Fic family protein [Microthrixaceae bacterium]
MRPDAFTSTERGRVRKTPEGYWAFVPAAAPRRLSLSDEVVKLLDEATGAVHRLGGVGRLIPNPHLLIGPHLRLEAVLSSRIEGTKTDVGQLLRFEAGQVPSPDAADDATEVTNYIVAMEHGLTRVRDGFPISVRLFREMHELLLQGARGQHRRPGELRKSPVWLGGATLDDAVFVPPPPDEMRDALSDLEKFLHETDLPLLVQLAIAHYQFEMIHPFLDGNGRIGRLMIPLMLVLRDALPQPLLYLSAFFEQHRSEYYDHLLITSQCGDLMPWIAFFLRGVRQQARDSEERTVRLVELQHQLRNQLLDEGRPNSVIRLAEQLFATPVVTAARVEAMIDVTRPTAQAAIDALVERGDLTEITGRTRGRVYEAGAIFEAVYGPVPIEESTVHPELPFS